MIGASTPARLDAGLAALLVLLGALALTVPAAIVQMAPSGVERLSTSGGRTRVVPKAIVPDVDPPRFRELAPADAVAFNASIPFSRAPNPAARPFSFTGEPIDRARAIDCLAAAALYEAGDDPEGQRPVIQVVLNRVRHPAFPKTICGVVFQGSDRQTGCQFTFTCDGALARGYSEEAWQRARALAAAAMDGRVYRPVGHATHYHTNWVVPYWSETLDKIVEVRTHLFFRWTGWWGTPPAFRFQATGKEPRIAKLAAWSPVHREEGETPAGLLESDIPTMVAPPPVLTSTVPAPVGDFDSFLIALDPTLQPDQFPAFAKRVCGMRVRCKFLAWRNADQARQAIRETGNLSNALLDAISFSYLRDRQFGYERALWNCNEYSRPDPKQCMRRTPGSVPNASPPAPRQALAIPPVAPPEVPAITGVRRKAQPQPPPPPAAKAETAQPTQE